jgi:integrase
MDNSLSHFIVTPYAHRPRTPWKVEIRASFAGKKICRFVTSYETGIALGQRMVEEIRARGTSAVVQTGTSVSKAVTMYLQIRAVGFTGSHQTHTLRVLGKFSEQFGTRSMDSIGPLDLHAFWDRPTWKRGASGRRNAFVYLRGFFNWAERYDLVARNPTRRVEPPATPKPLRNILTPEQMRDALQSAKDHHAPYMTAALCLGGFMGLRTDEVLQMTPASIDWKAKEIHVSQGKTGERFLKMLPAFQRHCPQDFKMANTRNFYKALNVLVDRLKWDEWPRNCLRHSAASYHLAASGNAAETALFLGHSSPKMVMSVYARAVRADDAKRWNAL